MSFKAKRLALALLLLLVLATQTYEVSGSLQEGRSARAGNVIFMVADGLGLANVTAARIYRNGPDGPALNMELRNVGYQRIYSSDSLITDSAASASAWACGEKFKNGEICLHSKDGSHKESLLELAGKKGRRTGLVATSEITAATPAAFAAHTPWRRCQNEIARQYVAVTGVDVLLGGGAARFQSQVPDPCGVSGDFLTPAISRGYCFVKDKFELEKAVGSGKTRLLGLFAERDLTPELGRTLDTAQPRLSQMAASALKVLEKNPEGFFLVIEGSLIDRANHAMNVEGQILETLAFDEAVKTVLDWIRADPAREKETLLIILADHETGGFAITGPKNSLPSRGQVVEGGWIGRGHTGTDVMIWSEGPGSNQLNKPGLNNTEVYNVVRDIL